MRIPFYNSSDFEQMRKAGKLAKETLYYAASFLKSGITTNQINDIVHDFIISNNAIPAPLNYKGFPKSVCTSINSVVCHGIPNDTELRDGDIINVDVTVILNGWYGDTSATFLIKDDKDDKDDELYKRQINIMNITKKALEIGINAVKVGNKIGDIGYAIQTFVEKNGYSVVRDFCGHGIGRKFHDAPEICHFGLPNTGYNIMPGMIFTIEPMVNEGTPDVVILSDGWTAVTQDKKLSAQYEHTLGVNANGEVVIFTE